MPKANRSRAGRHPAEGALADEAVAGTRPERDIPELLAEQALAASEARYRALVEEAPAVIYMEQGDREHTLLYMSPFVETLLGYPVEAFFADPGLWMARVHPEDRERVQAS